MNAARPGGSRHRSEAVSTGLCMQPNWWGFSTRNDVEQTAHRKPVGRPRFAARLVVDGLGITFSVSRFVQKPLHGWWLTARRSNEDHVVDSSHVARRIGIRHTIRRRGRQAGQQRIATVKSMSGNPSAIGHRGHRCGGGREARLRRSRTATHSGVSGGISTQIASQPSRSALRRAEYICRA